MYNITFQHSIITSNEAIEPDGFSCISFENIGDDVAVINTSIPLTPNSLSREFNFRPGEIIREKFSVKFDKQAQVRKVLVIKTYFNNMSYADKIVQAIENDGASIIDETTPGVTYLGYPANGAAVGQTKFKIKRITVAANITIIEWANGDQLQNKDWNLRDTYTYSFYK